MTNTTISRLHAALLAPAAVAAAATGVLLAPPAYAVTDSAAVTIGQLEAQGFDVRLDRVGSAPLDECEVTDVRNPREQTELVRVNRGGDRDRLVPIVVRRVVTVSLDCSR